MNIQKKIGVAIPKIKLGNVEANVREMVNLIERAATEKIEELYFSPMPLTGVSCGDVLHNEWLQNEIKKAFSQIVETTKNKNLTVAICVTEGKVCAVKSGIIEEVKKCAVDVCFSKKPSTVGFLKRLIEKKLLNKKTFVYVGPSFGESTTDGVYSGEAFIVTEGKKIAATTAFFAESQLIYGEVTVTENGGKIIEEETLNTTEKGFLIGKENCLEAFEIQTYGLVGRMQNVGIKNLVLGISGGLDSTLALLVCVKACDYLKLPRTNITAVTMPGFGTTDRTYNNAVALIKKLGCTFREISIKTACEQHFKDINHDLQLHNAVYENAQARERTQILMDIANQVSGIVIGTGDMSELALGWATYNGDQMSMYGVNAGVPKTAVRAIVTAMAKTETFFVVAQNLIDVVETPVSPELLPADSNGKIAQKTEDLVGPYELHDFFLYHFMHGKSPLKIYKEACAEFSGKWEKEIVKKWLYTFVRRFFAQQFKRSAMPDGPQIYDISLSPRGGWSMPSDMSAELWLQSINNL